MTDLYSPVAHIFQPDCYRPEARQRTNHRDTSAGHSDFKRQGRQGR